MFLLFHLRAARCRHLGASGPEAPLGRVREEGVEREEPPHRAPGQSAAAARRRLWADGSDGWVRKRSVGVLVGVWFVSRGGVRSVGFRMPKVALQYYKKQTYNVGKINRTL